MNDRKGGFSAASYATLMIGTKDSGVVIHPGNAQGSRLIEMIESGDMPRGGLTITASERSVLEQWINDGAKFDGDNPSTVIANLAGTPIGATKTVVPVPVVPNTDVVAVRSNETVSFAGDIAPILVRECIRCHGEDRSQNGLSFASFDTLRKGGESGPILNRETPTESLLLKKLLGTASGQRMPLNRPALTEADVERIQTWIREGASFDGPNPAIAMANIAAIHQARNLSHGELAEKRIRLAKQNWNLAFPNNQPTLVTTEHFLVVGSRPEQELKQIGEIADQQAATIRKLLRGNSAEPFVKGRATLFIIDRQYDYSEFGNMVEQRQFPTSQRAHWQYSLVDAYCAVLLPRDSQLPAAHLAEQIATIYVANLGLDVPPWFATSISRVVAARMEPRDPHVAGWGAT